MIQRSWLVVSENTILNVAEVLIKIFYFTTRASVVANDNSLLLVVKKGFHGQAWVSYI